MSELNNEYPALPEVGIAEPAIPSSNMEQVEIPKVGNRENIVVIGGEEIEIKPTKV
jgi:hypothetical protein